MHLKLLSATLIAALSIGCASTNQQAGKSANDVNASPGYVGAHGYVLKSSSGECVKDSRWSADQAIAICTSPSSAGSNSQIAFFNEKVLFDTNKATLTAIAKAALNQVAKKLRKASDNKKIIVIGHADNRGNAAYNQDLSERRAKAVKDFFVASGFGHVKINASGQGERNPVASNNTSEGRRNNRRVEVGVPR